MRGDELQKSSLLSRALVRTAISRYQIHSRVSPKSLVFGKNAHGKPEVGLIVHFFVGQLDLFKVKHWIY
ncbi:putative 4'-phosphopantetheinyl transferase domain superfamily [Helianthus anomalus]